MMGATQAHRPAHGRRSSTSKAASSSPTWPACKWTSATITTRGKPTNATPSCRRSWKKKSPNGWPPAGATRPTSPTTSRPRRNRPPKRRKNSTPHSASSSTSRPTASRRRTSGSNCPPPRDRLAPRTCGPSNCSRGFGKSTASPVPDDTIVFDGLPDARERRWAEENGFRAVEFTVDAESAFALLERGVPFLFTMVDAGYTHSQVVVGFDRLPQLAVAARSARSPHQRGPAEGPSRTLLAVRAARPWRPGAAGENPNCCKELRSRTLPPIGPTGGKAVPAHRARSARQRARRTPLEELTPATWRAYRASDPASAIPVMDSSTLTGVPAARWPQMKLDRARRIVVQPELQASRDSPGISEPGQPAQRGGGHPACGGMRKPAPVISSPGGAAMIEI